LLSIFALLALILACLGFGLQIFRATGTERFFYKYYERLSFGFVLGLGILGWLLFFPGLADLFGSETFWVLISLGGGLGVANLVRERPPRFFQNLSTIEKSLIAFLCLTLAYDLFEGLSPPADTDTLAYHFAVPRDFLRQEKLVFIARAIDGAIPFLTHLTYAAALAIGDELTLTLWTTVTGWIPAVLLYGLLRNTVDRVWALTAVNLFLTTPAVLYGGGSGQMEMRCAMFVLVSFGLLLKSREHGGNLRLLALSGLAAGFFVGTKYFGLIFAGAIGLVVLFHRQWIRRATIFGAVVLLAGFQWYLWNFINTGDPVFPVLTNLFQYPDSEIWTQEFGRYFKILQSQSELPMDLTLLNWVSYPVYSIFNVIDELEGGRVGFGVFCMLILPFFGAGIISRDLRKFCFVAPLFIAAVFFTVWFFGGVTQRSRHLLPVYPLVLAGLFPVAVAFARRSAAISPLVAGLIFTLGIQITGQTVFAANHIRYLISDETRDEFLYRNVRGSNIVEWINHNLPAHAYVAFQHREQGYLLLQRNYLLHPYSQALIDSRVGSTDEERFYAQSQKVGITHLLYTDHWDGTKEESSPKTPFQSMLGRLIDNGCLSKLYSASTIAASSRTLRQFGSSEKKFVDAVFAFVPNKCPNAENREKTTN
jgi:hypothetical protein